MRFLLGALAVITLAAGCTGSGDTATEPTPTAVAEPPTAEATSAPTPDPSDAIGPADRIDAAVSQLDADIEAGAGPVETIAYDLLDSTVDDEGNVTLTICAWTGDTPFDIVRESLFRTTVDNDGTVAAAHVTSPVAPGECVNNQLIESAFSFINEFDSYWTEISAEPTKFATDQRTDTLLTDSYQSRAADLTNQWLSDGIYFETSTLPSDVRQASVADFLFRRYKANDLQLLEIVTCREMNPASGAYKDGILFDTERTEASPGSQAIDAYQLVAQPGTSSGWRLAGTDALIWADCFETGDWPRAANVWRNRDTQLEVLER